MTKIFSTLLFLFVVAFSTMQSTILDENFDLTQLKGKNLGYYIGSFDPIHLGHQHVIDTALQENHVDFVLIYPAPGGDSFKNRNKLHLRQKMIASVYKDNPKVLLTSWSPKQLQDHFECVAKDVSVVGIIGSDVITEKFYGSDKELGDKYLKVFMRGMPLTEKHFEDTAGALIALKADSFLVALRGNVDLAFLHDSIHDRPIAGYIQSKGESSTQVRNAILIGEAIDALVDASVVKIIHEENLYHPGS